MEYLEPKNERALSFYKKAVIEREESKIRLKSYETYILEYDTDTKELKFLTDKDWHFTQTTNRHIREFLYQFTEEDYNITRRQILQKAGIL